MQKSMLLHVGKVSVITIAVMTGVFSVSYLVLAFAEPSQAPPAGNVPAPINVGSTAQNKPGDLGVVNLNLGVGGNEGSIFKADVIQGFNDLRFFANASKNVPIYLEGNPVIINNDSGTGNVGIGNTSAQYKLHVNAATTIPKNRNLNFGGSFGAEIGVSSMFLTIGQSADDTTLAQSQPTAVGLLLQNDSNTDNTFAPLLGWSHKSNSGQYSQFSAGIAGRRTTQSGDSNWHGGELHFYTAGQTDRTIGLQSSRMMISSSGNVGIGTASPVRNLDIQGAVSGSVGQQGGTAFLIGDSIGASTKKNLKLGVDTSVGTNGIGWIQYTFEGTTHAGLSLNPLGGNVGIGTTDPGAYRLKVAGKISGTELCIGDTCKDTWPTGMQGTGTDNYLARWDNTSALQSSSVYVKDTGEVGIGTNDPLVQLHIDKGAGTGLAQEVLRIESVDTSATSAGIKFYADKVAAGGIFGGRTSGSERTLDIQHFDGQPGARPALRFFTTQENVGLVERMSILAGGNVGIGATVPNRLLHVYKDTGDNAEIDIQSVQGANKHWAIYQDRTSEDLRFWNNTPSGEKNILTLTDEGRVGIGTATPGTILDVFTATTDTLVDIRATGVDSDARLRFINDARSWLVTVKGSEGLADSFVIRDGTAGANRFSIDTSGNVGIGDVTPSGTIGFSDPTRSIFWETTPGQPNSRAWEIIGEQGAYGILQIRSSDANDNAIDRNVMTFNHLGNVGIGTADPGTEKLKVVGSIRATQDICTDAGGGKCLSATGGVGGSGSAGRVAFWTDASNLGFNNNLFWDVANARLGIGTPNPGAKLEINQNVSASGSPTALLITGAAHTTLDNKAETIDVNFNLARTVQFAGGRNMDTQRAVLIQAPTYAAASGAPDIVNATTLAISGPPARGANLHDITTAAALRIFGGNVGSGGRGTATNAYGLYVDAPTGATNNYAATFAAGNVGIGTTDPKSKLHIKDGQTWGSDLSIDAKGLTLAGRRWSLVSTGGNAGEGVGKFLIKDNDVPGAAEIDKVRLTIDTAGNVGIGTTGPDSKLAVMVSGGADVTALTIGTPNNAGVKEGDITRINWHQANFNDGARYRIASIASVLHAGTFGIGGDLVFYTKESGGDNNPTERMILTRIGNVGINRMDPTAKLTVNNPNTANKAGSAGDAIYAYANSTNAAISAEQGNASGFAGYFAGDLTLTGGFYKNVAKDNFFGTACGSGTFVVSITATGTLNCGTPTGTIDGSGTAGAVTFWQDVNTIAADADKLFWDQTNKRLGIGTADPKAQLHIDNGATKGLAQEVLRIESIDSSATSAGIKFYADGMATGGIFGGRTSESERTLDIQHFDAQPAVRPALRFFTTQDGGVGLQERLSILAGGNVGIGTSGPEKLLHLKTVTGSNVEINIQSGGANKWSIYHDEGSEDLRFWNNDAPGDKNMLTLKNTGNVGIGTTDPAGTLEIRDSSPDLILQRTNNVNLARLLYRNSGGNYIANIAVTGVSNGNLVFRVGPNEANPQDLPVRLTITNGGEVSIENNLKVAGQSVCREDRTNCPATAAHNLLSATHGDTTAGTVARGDIIAGIGPTPTWQKLKVGATGTVLHGGTELSYSAVSLTADVTGILPSANGGTGMAFFTVAGPAASAKTFTFPNANATVLTTNATVTVAQGGTSLTTVAAGSVLAANAANALSAITSTQGTKVLTNTGGAITWETVSASIRLDQIVEATATNTIANANFAQIWNWRTLTTQTGMTFGGGSAMTTGSIFALRGAKYIHAAAETGSLFSLTFTDASTNATGNSVTNGMNIVSAINTSGAGTKAINAITIASPTKTACTTGACTWTGLAVANPGTLANTTFYAATFAGGNVGIGTTDPTAVLHLKAGTGTAKTAPLKFTSGTNLNTPEVGAVEFNGSELFLTITGTSPTRKTLAFTDSNITGNAATATALAADPSDCTGTQFAKGIVATGAATCADLPPPSPAWSSLTDPTTTLGLTMGAGKETTFTVQSTTQSGFTWQSSTLTSGDLVKLIVTSTGSNAEKALNIAVSGANANAARTSYGGYISVTNTGTTSTNVGLYVTASGATNNYAAIFASGNVGIGDTKPSSRLVLGGTGLTNGITFGDDSADPVTLYRSDAKTLTIGDNLKVAGTLTVGGNSVLTVETDPQVNTLTANKWCVANTDALAIDCTANAPLVSIPTLQEVTAAGASTSIKVLLQGTAEISGAAEPLVVKNGKYYFFAGANRGGGDYVDIGAYHTEAGWKNLILNRDGGNVGIGTTKPIANLHVAQGTTGVGTVSNDFNGTTVTGVGTQFTNTFKVGDTITIGSNAVKISEITSDTRMTTEIISVRHTDFGYTLVGGDRFVVKGNGNVKIEKTLQLGNAEIYWGDNDTPNDTTDDRLVIKVNK